MTTLSHLIRSAERPIAMPVATFPGAALSGMTVRELVTDATKQSLTQLALHRRFNTPVLLSCMDLSVEAEAFGAQVLFSDEEVPTVTGRMLTDEAGVAGVRAPSVGEGRTQVYLEAVRQLVAESRGLPVLAGMIGPFSLSGRLFGVSEALLATATEPELVEALLEVVTPFLTAYAAAFNAAGARGVIIAEPSAGLLSPRGLATFSSAYIARIIKEVEGEAFEVILHNCAAQALHLEALRTSGAHILHFGAPMDMVAALRALSPHAIVCGNLDPAGVFVHSTPQAVAEQTRRLLDATKDFPSFVISSGCDIPRMTPLANLDAFYQEVDRGIGIQERKNV